MATTSSQLAHTKETIATLAGTLASGAYLNSGVAGAINNIPSLGTTVSYDLMDVFINFGTTAVTLGSNPSIGFTTLDSSDGGTTFESPGTVTAAPAGVVSTKTVPYTPSSVIAVGTELKIPDVSIGTYEFLSLILNNTGATWPAGTTIKAVRKTLANW
jgi:hypothetical protein